jgi:hypothetical protein
MMGGGWTLHVFLLREFFLSSLIQPRLFFFREFGIVLVELVKHDALFLRMSLGLVGVACFRVTSLAAAGCFYNFVKKRLLHLPLHVT